MRSIIGAGAIWLALCAAAPAQDYPTRTIRVIIPLGAGGGGDVFTRALADELQKALRQPVVVENRTGGALNIGARACAEAAPDGYTICVLSSEPVVYNQFVFKSLPFDPEKDFEPISNLFFNTLALVANSSLKVKTIADLVALAKARPRHAELRHVLIPARAFYGKAQDRDRRRYCAGTVQERQRSGQCGLVGIDSRRGSRAVQHGPATAERSHHRPRGDGDNALPAFPNYPHSGGSPQRRELPRNLVRTVRARRHAQADCLETRERGDAHRERS